MRKPFTPKSVNLFDIHGKLSAKHQQATVFAEYLSWCAPREHSPIPPSPSSTIDCDSPFTMAELNIVLRSLSRRRAPGPDTITTDMLKGSPYVLKLFLLDHYNHCLSTSTTPNSWTLSKAVMLVKKIQLGNASCHLENAACCSASLYTEAQLLGRFQSCLKTSAQGVKFA